MKRICAWLLAVLMILSLTACGNEPAKDVFAPDEEIEEVETPVEDTQEEPAPEVEPEPVPEEEPKPEQPTTNSGSTDPAKPKIPQSEKAYLVRINLTHCTVNIYTKDENGEYTVPLKAMICSTGYATPGAGTFYRLGNTWEWLRLKGNVWGHYVTQITGNILFHSVPYLRWNDPASLEYWEFDKLGVKASQGCIRLLVSDAIWIYNNAWNIVGVEFYRDEDPGPFGKPTAPKISDNELCRDWDPTDPNPANPWHTYVAEHEGEVIDPETELPAEGEESTPVEGEQSPVSEGEDAPVEETPAETPEGEQSETEGTEPPAAEETPAEGDVTEGTEGAADETAEEPPAENTAENSEALPSAA
ncbi:MAG: hypothetical protein IKB53_01135 [Oscillospiraceae bacterium]|nr:hypothetical protein [Oscillospiraceae bacterium]